MCRTATRILLSPILFVIYSSVLDSQNGVRATAYVDYEVARVRATRHRLAVKAPQNHLDQRINIARFVNIRYAPKKADLIDLIPSTSRRQSNNTDKRGIELYGPWIPLTDKVKILGVHIDNHLSFKTHAAKVSTNTRRNAGTLYRITRKKGVSPNSIHHLVNAVTMPTMLWGLEIWWTGARRVLDRLTPAYNQLTRTITGLPRWTPLLFRLKEAETPPLHLLLDRTSQAYGVRTLCQKDDHPCKSLLLRAIRAASSESRTGTGLQRIADLV